MCDRINRLKVNFMRKYIYFLLLRSFVVSFKNLNKGSVDRKVVNICVFVQGIILWAYDGSLGYPLYYARLTESMTTIWHHSRCMRVGVKRIST